LRRPDRAQPRRELLHRLVRARPRDGPGDAAELALPAHQRRRAAGPARRRGLRRPGGPDARGEPPALLHPLTPSPADALTGLRRRPPPPSVPPPRPTTA